MTDARIQLQPDGRYRVLAAAPARERWSWALYDFANTIFSMNIVTLYFAVWIVTERGASTTAYSLATSFSSALVLVLAPWVGAVSDASRRRKPWVVALTLVCVAATLALAPCPARALPAPTAILALLAAFVLANTAYQLALPPYNAMLSELVPPSERGRLSGFGTALGYVGSIAGDSPRRPFVDRSPRSPRRRTPGGLRAHGRALSCSSRCPLFSSAATRRAPREARPPCRVAGNHGRARGGLPRGAADGRGFCGSSWRPTSTRTRSGRRSPSWRSTP